MNNSKVIVTGAAGFIGSALSEKLIEMVVGRRLDELYPEHAIGQRKGAVLEVRELSGEGIEKVWGLERGTRARMVLLQRDGAGEGTTGLVQFTGTGKPASSGLFLLSFPVEDVEKLFKTLAGSRVAIVCPPTDTDLPPYGQARIATVRSPDGLLLEFVQWREKTVDGGSQAAVEGNLERGRKTFVEQCSVCHTIENPRGSGPPGLKGVFRQTHLSSSGEPVTEENVKKIILEGRPGMPRIFLEEQQLKDLLAYLKTL